MLALTAVSHRPGAESATHQAVARMTPFLLTPLALPTAGSLTPLISPAAPSSRPMPQRVAAQASPAMRPEIIHQRASYRPVLEPSRQPETSADISSTAVTPLRDSLADLVWQAESPLMPDTPEVGVRMRRQPAVDEQSEALAVAPRRDSLADLVWQGRKSRSCQTHQKLASGCAGNLR
ncbi:MAG: hypothetical protein IPM76_16515 [Chloroflexi bacterium]|nr:hypothetical protein [Chloroflexota bacterium]